LAVQVHYYILLYYIIIIITLVLAVQVHTLRLDIKGSHLSLEVRGQDAELYGASPLVSGSDPAAIREHTESITNCRRLLKRGQDAQTTLLL
jgi:hypothetical protein